MCELRKLGNIALFPGVCVYVLPDQIHNIPVDGFAQARAAARIYRRECDGVGIYDFRLGVVRETIGDFQPI